MTPHQPRHLTGDKDAINEFIDQFDTFLFDCDGVLWSGDHVFEGVTETLQMLRDKGKRTVFVTNNSTKSRADCLKRLTSMGLPATVEDVFGSAYSSAIYISRVLEQPSRTQPKVFVIGESGIEDELAEEKVDFVGGTDAAYRREITPEDFRKLADGSGLDPHVGLVLCGLDFHINYLKLAHAHAYLKRGATFLATNTDSTLPMNNSFFPGAGSISSSPLSNMLGKMPVECGKPSKAMMDAIESKFHLDRHRTCMVGDRIETDIKFGNEGRLGATLAVLTGVMKREDFEKEDAETRPTSFVDKLSDLGVVRAS